MICPLEKAWEASEIIDVIEMAIGRPRERIEVRGYEGSADRRKGVGHVRECTGSSGTPWEASQAVALIVEPVWLICQRAIAFWYTRAPQQIADGRSVSMIVKTIPTRKTPSPNSVIFLPCS